MPFKSSSDMEQKQSFIRDYLSDEFTFSSLCEAYKISRRAGYDLVARYKSSPEDYFLQCSKRPLTSPGSTSTEVIDQIKYWRERKKSNRWGAKKIRVKLLKKFSESEVPSVTTIHNILLRNGLVKIRKRRRIVVPQHPVFDPTECNEIWSIDHKGKFYLGNGKRCSPLTICDSHSRYLFMAKGRYTETWKDVQRQLIGVFREYGMPQYLHSDNGSAFASIQSPRGFGSLSYWLLDLGIMPVFSDPGRPTQNGRHERMHRDLKAECCAPAWPDLRVQNRKHNEFVYEYNHIRPHEALDMLTPAEVHCRSNRIYPECIQEAEYGSEMEVFKVYDNGNFRLNGSTFVSVSRGLRNRYVGLKRLGNRVCEVYYRSVCLGYFQEGVDVKHGHYYRLRSDDDLPARWQHQDARRRK